jgi:hypothetical protein
VAAAAGAQAGMFSLKEEDTKEHNKYLQTCILVSRSGCTTKSHRKEIYNISFEGTKQFSYFGTTITNRNSIHEVTKSRMKSGNACYLSVQNLLSSSLLSKNIKIKVYRTIMLPVVVYGCETWSLTVREEQRLRVFENRVLRRILGAYEGRGDRGVGKTAQRGT